MKKALVIFGFVALGLLALGTGASANLVVNGTFQDTLINWDGTVIEVPSWQGWTQVPAVQGSNYWLSALPDAPSTYQAYFQGPGPDLDTIGQAIQTVSGMSYTFSFRLAQPQPLTDFSPGDFKVYWNDTEVLRINDTRDFDWTWFTFTETATGPSTAINFSGRANTNWHSAYGFFLTDISVTPVPVPGAFALLGSALISLIGWRRLRKS